MNDAAAKAPLSDPVNLRKTSDERIEHGVGLALLERVYGTPSGLIDDHPTSPLREHFEGSIGRGQRSLIFGLREGSDFDRRAGLQIPTLVALRNDTPSHPHRTPRQQAANLGSRQLQAFGEKTIQALASILLADRQ
jgi:hypothetical protein